MRLRPAVMAWGAWGLFAVVASVTVVLAVVAGTPADALVVLAFGYATAGALVAARAPRNVVGWLLLATALAWGLEGCANVYITVSELPGRTAVGWYAAWSYHVWLVIGTQVLPLVFPTGRLLSPRWRLAVWNAIASLVLTVAGTGLAPGHLDLLSDAVRIDNPWGVDESLSGVVTATALTGQVLSGIGLVLSGLCLIMRMRRAHGTERQQLKWFAYMAGLVVTGLVIVTVGSIAGDTTGTWKDVVIFVGWWVAVLSLLLGLPVAVGMAVLKHRLYDIDLVIKRTLVYGSLTALLVAVYLSLVLILRVALSPVTGESDLEVAGSTLAVAALFRPVRGRIQRLVDQRFYRARYDAARTLEMFSGHLREEVDLETLGADLRHVVHNTMQPAHVSLWLRECQ